MPTDRYDDLAAFRAFLDAKLADPGNDLTLAEVLALWEAENQTDDERDEAHRCVGDGLAFIIAPTNRRSGTTPSTVGPEREIEDGSRVDNADRSDEQERRVIQHMRSLGWSLSRVKDHDRELICCECHHPIGNMAIQFNKRGILTHDYDRPWFINCCFACARRIYRRDSR